jgi:hypothetical protein
MPYCCSLQGTLSVVYKVGDEKHMTYHEITRLEDELRALGERFDEIVKSEKDLENSLELKGIHKKMTDLEKKLREYAKKKKVAKIAAVIDILELRIAAALKDIKGVSPGDKDHKRMQDIVTKSKGNNDKIIQLVMNMAKSIDDSDKARRRGEAALANLPVEVADRASKIFFARADYLAA